MITELCKPDISATWIVKLVQRGGLIYRMIIRVFTPVINCAIRGSVCAVVINAVNAEAVCPPADVSIRIKAQPVPILFSVSMIFTAHCAEPPFCVFFYVRICSSCP